MKIKKFNPGKFLVVLVLLMPLFGNAPIAISRGQAFAETKAVEEKKSTPALDTLLEKIEKRYAGSEFSAAFEQQSTIAAMEITDNASGKLFVKRPGRMRWEYLKPEVQIIISDGDDLWIYRPEDKQVMVGKAPSFFANGKGAAFLSDLKTLRTEFTVSLEKADAQGNPVLKLIPHEKTAELAEIHLTVSQNAHTIDQIVTLNSYGDETRIRIDNYRFNQDLDKKMFYFEVPSGVDVLQLDQN